MSGIAPARAAYTCTVTAADISFGTYSALNSTNVNGTGSVTVNCSWISGNQTITILVALGTGGSGSFTPRTMTSASDSLNYNLYRNAARTQIWGDGTGGTVTYTTPNCVLRANRPTCSNTRTIYGRIPAGQNVDAGSYADTIVVTITF